MKDVKDTNEPVDVDLRVVAFLGELARLGIAAEATRMPDGWRITITIPAPDTATHTPQLGDRL